jgi:hypothetical protein
MTGRSVAALVLVAALAAPSPAGAQDGSPWRTRLRVDAVMRWAPRYVIEVEQTEVGRDRLFWRRADTLPLYLRVAVDSEWTGAEGRAAVDLHTAAWAGLDTMFGANDAGLAAGDFGVAYGRFTYSPVSVWAGRRFVPWGPPGGLHLDGGGVELHTRTGLAGDVVVGRPVTPTYDTLLGVRPDFEGATLAYGARVGYRHPGRVSASVAYTEQWARGIVADRLISAEATGLPHRRVDLRGSVVFDPAELAVEQATAQAYVLAADWLEVDAGYAFTDPTRLLPRWSILAAFASGAFHETSAGGTLTFRHHLIRLEGALRRYGVPGRDDVAGWWGYRADLTYRVAPTHRRYSIRAGASRRGEDQAGLTVVHAAAAWAVWRMLELAFEGAVSIDDDRARSRDSYLARLTLEASLGRDWYLGLTVDGARTAFVEAEARAMLRASFRPSWGGAR